MAFSDLVDILDRKQTWPKGTTDRYKRLDTLQRALNGTIYNDAFTSPFELEDDITGKYIPVKQRRPAVVYMLPKIIVDHTKSLLFGEDHAPSVRVVLETEDPEYISKQHKMFERLIEAIELDATCMEIMYHGAVGSVMVVLQSVDDGTPWFEIIDGKECKPLFDPRNPNKLLSVERVYCCGLDELEQAGYDRDSFDEDKAPYWIRITYTKSGEARSHPMPNEKYQRLGEKDAHTGEVIHWILDPDRSYQNPFSFMNAIWVRNLERRREVDGESTFGEVAVDFMTEISYLLSQIGRGFRYSADPTVAIKRGELNAISPIGGFSGQQTQDAGSSRIQKSPNRAITVPPGGDIKLLEITGNGLHQAAEFVRLLREYALEVISGMKADQQHATSVHSGRALEMLHRVLIWLAERLRISYGTRCFLVLLKMVMQGIQEGVLKVDGVDSSDIDLHQPLRLVWPQWETPSGTDLLATVQAYEMAAGGSPASPVPIADIEYVAQKTASALGISDSNRAAAALMKKHGDTPLPIDDRQKTLGQADKQLEIDAKAPKASGGSNS